jgi:hypothetical protein
VGEILLGNVYFCWASFLIILLLLVWIKQSNISEKQKGIGFIVLLLVLIPICYIWSQSLLVGGGSNKDKINREEARQVAFAEIEQQINPVISNGILDVSKITKDQYNQLMKNAPIGYSVVIPIQNVRFLLDMRKYQADICFRAEGDMREIVESDAIILSYGKDPALVKLSSSLTRPLLALKKVNNVSDDPIVRVEWRFPEGMEVKEMGLLENADPNKCQRIVVAYRVLSSSNN